MNNPGKYIIPFGKYKGEYIGDLPAWYLIWLYDQDWIVKFKEVMEYIAANYERLELEAKREEQY